MAPVYETPHREKISIYDIKSVLSSYIVNYSTSGPCFYFVLKLYYRVRFRRPLLSPNSICDNIYKSILFQRQNSKRSIKLAHSRAYSTQSHRHPRILIVYERFDSKLQLPHMQLRYSIVRCNFSHCSSGFGAAENRLTFSLYRKTIKAQNPPLIRIRRFSEFCTNCSKDYTFCGRSFGISAFGLELFCPYALFINLNNNLFQF